MAQARHRITPETHSPESDLLDAVWDVTKSYALRLRDFIMQRTFFFRYPPGFEPPSSSSASSSASSSSSSSSADLPAKIPSLATRRAACTHLTMGRLYGDFRCNVCNLPSPFGWVYSCTQDDTPLGLVRDVNQHLGGLAEYEEEMKGGVGPEDKTTAEVDTFRMPTLEFSPSVQKAVEDGQYTAAQITTLQAQKQHVVHVARVAVERFDESQRAANYPSPTPSQPENEEAQIPSLTLNDAGNASALPEPSETDPSTMVSKLKMFPHCEYRACQCCRPTYRDRTWLCLDEIFALNTPIPAQAFADDNRPVARASIMRNIGLRLKRGRAYLRHIGGKNFYSLNGQSQTLRPQFPQISPDSSDSSDIADEGMEPESRGFRDSMKRAFKGMMRARHHPPRRLGRKRRMRETTSSDECEDAEEFDMGLWTRLNDDLLQEASSVPLPFTASDSIDESSVELEETDIAGVAVTEEAAEMNAADIIMSV